MAYTIWLLAVAALSTAFAQECPDYTLYAAEHHGPASSGRHQLPFQRPEARCRTFVSAEVEAAVEEMRGAVADEDLFRLFENCFPNTLDTAVHWRGVADAPGAEKRNGGTAPKELTFITTGDINAMWLRDSANQLQSYRSLLTNTSSLGQLYRGAINLHARYIRAAPYCNAFRPPPESGLFVEGGFGLGDAVTPPVDHAAVYECKYELDSLAAFLQLSNDYFEKTGDLSFFGLAFTQFANTQGGSSDDFEYRSEWVQAVEAVVRTASDMLQGTYDGDEKYTFQRGTNVASETLSNNGAGSPVKGGTGLVRSAFRPSDDACTYQLFVPGNMMLAVYLDACANIVRQLGHLDSKASETSSYTYWNGHRKRYHSGLATRMRRLAAGIRSGIEQHGRTQHSVFGTVYAYEVDGFGSHNLMDDANIPSLLSAPLIKFVDRRDPVYQNTRRFVLSRYNPYYMEGPAINGTGGPHVGIGMAWPMAVIVQIMTEDDDETIYGLLKSLLGSTGGLGLMHEAVDSKDASKWTRPWFSWANGLFGEMMLDLKERKPHLLKRSYQ